MDSPCQNICHLNPRTRHCDGCGRSSEEIASWIRLTPCERREIMAALPDRMRQLNPALECSQ